MKKFTLKSSFTAGAVALTFLIVGYQTAVFVHSAAVAGIAADRDCPDTVFIAELPDAEPHGGVPCTKDSGRRSGNGSGNQPWSACEVRAGTGQPGADRRQYKVVGRSSGARDAAGARVRENVPRRKAESFRFNPNTVSTEDLQRLGFSQKQAAAIDNYRKKGGRFRRKGDFAKSFVVSDSVYQRLEAYIDIPLTDINLADSAAFDALPGIGGWFARQMVAYRERLGGYSFKEQLMEIRNFDREKYDGLSDLICVSPETTEPYGLWTLPEETLKRHPYIGNAAHGIVLFRQSQPRERWSIENLKSEKILSGEDAERLGRCRIALP